MGKSVKIVALSEEDIRSIKYQCRFGYILPLIFLIFGLVSFSMIYISKAYVFSLDMVFLSISGVLCLSLLFSYLMNRKFKADIRNNEKEVETNIIQSKKSSMDHQSNTVARGEGGKLNNTEVFSIVVDNFRYVVDEEFFNNCAEGDELLLNYAPLSRHLIGIEHSKSHYVFR